MTTLSVVVPTRGLEPLLRVCLDRLATAVAHADRVEPLAARVGDDPLAARIVSDPARVASEALAARVVVVDNATPRPIELATSGDPPDPPVDVLRFDVHQSFARCCNRAVATAPADLVLLLNNDVLLAPRALAAMRAAIAADPTVGIAGTRLVFPDGRLQHAGVRFAPTLGPYHHARGRDAATVPRGLERPQAVTGACMLIRSGLWDELGGLDEAYPFGLEDIDFCLRAGRAGWTVRCPQAVDSLHFESMTPGRVELDPPSRRLFMERWHGRYTIDGEDPRD